MNKNLFVLLTTVAVVSVLAAGCVVPTPVAEAPPSEAPAAEAPAAEAPAAEPVTISVLARLYRNGGRDFQPGR